MGFNVKLASAQSFYFNMSLMSMLDPWQEISRLLASRFPPRAPTIEPRALPSLVINLGFDPDQPRDEHGRWTDAGGGDGGGKAGKHPGHGYSAKARLDKNGVIHTSDIYDATRALYEDREVVLTQPREVATLVEHLGEVTKKMIELGAEAPRFNLCNVSVKGTNLFCADTKDIPRIKMPQLDAEQTKAFRKHLAEQGYAIEKTKEFASYLRATQNELDGAKVAKIADKIRKNPKEGQKRLIVSRDNYILDGHHHWGARLGLNAEEGKLNKGEKMRIARVDIDIVKLLKEADKFTGGKGKKKDFEDFEPCLACGWDIRAGFDPDEPRDESGRWTEGGGSAESSPTAFISPNVEQLDFDQAVAALDSERQAQIAETSRYIDEQLGIDATTQPTIGAWSDGAENSLMITAHGASPAQVRAASAMKGYLADQKAVLVFTPDSAGGEFLASFSVKDNLNKVHDRLLQDGLAFHTLEPSGAGKVRVHVYGSDQATLDAVGKTSKHYGTEADIVIGGGEFIGTKLESGSDREQRDDARRVYDKVIREISDSGELQGRDLGSIWNAVRNHWQPAAKALAFRAGFDPEKHPRHPAGSSEGGEFAPAGEGGVGGGETAPAPEVKPEESLNPIVVEVGGDAWNRATARRLEREYQKARPAVDKLANEAVGKQNEQYELVDVDDEEPEGEPPYEPEEWDDLSASGQQQAEEEYINKNKDSYLQSEVDYWYEEHASDEAKEQVAHQFNEEPEQWALDALNELRANRKEEDMDDFPFSNDDLLKATTIDYEAGSSKDPEVEFNDEFLNKKMPVGYNPAQMTLPGMEPIEPAKLLTDEMRNDIEETLLEAFEKEAGDLVDKLDPPDYLSESAEEMVAEGWHSMSDKDKFEWVKGNTSIVEDETTEGTGDYEDQSKPSEAVGVEALPKKFDPLNETTGRDYQLTQKLARHLSIERTLEVLKERELASPTRGAVASIDQRLWGRWKDSSTSEDGKLLQLATADELGGRLNVRTGKGGTVVIDRDELTKYANDRFAAIGGYAGVKAYIRAKWETTQYLLDKAGINDLGLYRGITLDKAKVEEAMKGAKKVGGFTHLPTLHVDRNGAASTSVDNGVASDWDGDADRVVLRAHVPRTAALSVPAYGINVHSEKEVVVAGTSWKNWDAWLGKAPSFESEPVAKGSGGIGHNAPLSMAA
jgi:hypothetical protein